MTYYFNPRTKQYARCNSQKADKDGNVWVEINGAIPVKRNWDEFRKEFCSLASIYETKKD